MNKMIGIVRYSVLVRDKNSWKIGKNNDWDAYKEKVLDDKRLKDRFKIFKEVTVPSLLGNTVPPCHEWFKLYIFVSDMLPKERWVELSNFLSDYKWCEVVPVPEKGSLGDVLNIKIQEFVEADEIFGTFRIDDDDALGKTYIQNFSKYINGSYLNHAITFPYGLQGYFDKKLSAYTKMTEIWSPKIALGLGFVSSFSSEKKNVFEIGSHTKIDKRFPLLSVPSGPMFIRTLHEGNDSVSDKEGGRRRRKIDDIIDGNNEFPLVEVANFFSVSEVIKPEV